MNKHFPSLFSPGVIGSVNLKNRLIMSLYPTKYVEDSRVTDRMVAWYRARAQGGVAMIVLDPCCLDYPAAYKGANELRMDTDDHADGLRRVLDAVQGAGARAFIQLSYPAQMAAEPGSPGAVEKKGGWVVPLVTGADTAFLDGLPELFAKGAVRAREIGYDGVEIQAGWGATLAQFLSPLTNARRDGYGGDPAGRARLPLAIVRAVKVAAGLDFPVQVKLVADELCAGGFDLGQAQSVAKEMERAGADAILVTVGNKKTKAHAIPPHSLPHGVSISYARALKKVVDIPVIAMGKIGGAELAEATIAGGHADMVAMTRALIADPDLPRKSAAGETAEIRGCIYCLDDCADNGVAGFGRACVNNPHAGLESEITIDAAVEPQKVWVVGGGPAGMQAALTCAQRGHYVKLFERAGHLGGQFRLAALTPYKAEVGEVLRWLELQIEKGQIDYELNSEVTAEQILEARPDVVVLATGGQAKRPLIPGVDGDHVFSAVQFLEMKIIPAGNVVVVGGGDLGCEIAEYAAARGSKVALVEILDELMSETKSVPRADMLRRLSEQEVEIMTRTAMGAIRRNDVVVTDKDGSELIIPADQVIYATGNASVKSLYHDIKDKISRVYLIGDADEPGNVGHALRTAFRAAAQL